MDFRKYTGVYLRNAILITEIFCYRYSTINNSLKKQYFSTKFSSHFSTLLRMKCAKLYLDSFRFDIFVVHCLGVYFFTGHSECIDNVGESHSAAAVQQRQTQKPQC